MNERLYPLVMDDPDLFELEEATGIGIFEPGSLLEDQIDGNRMLGILGYTALGMVLLVMATFIIMIPLMSVGLIRIYPTLYIDPIALIITTAAEVTFVIPPMYYIRKNGLPRAALGFKNMMSPVDALLGLVFGGLMIAANLGISWVLTEATGPNAPPEPGSMEVLLARNWPEMIAWRCILGVEEHRTTNLLH
jgi:hypothetical protein